MGVQPRRAIERRLERLPARGPRTSWGRIPDRRSDAGARLQGYFGRVPWRWGADTSIIRARDAVARGRPGTPDVARIRRRLSMRPKWRNGRRAGLKIRWGNTRVGSSPTFGSEAQRLSLGFLLARLGLRPFGCN